jgi:hypothetical protein
MNNDIKVTGIVDHEDGSATVTLDLSPETYHKIFEYGFLKLDMKEEDIKKLEELAKRLYEQKQEDKEIDDDGFITIYESSRGSTVKEDAPKD